MYIFIYCKPQGFYDTLALQENHLKMQVDDSDATLACRIKRFDDIATSCLSGRKRWFATLVDIAELTGVYRSPQQ